MSPGWGHFSTIHGSSGMYPVSIMCLYLLRTATGSGDSCANGHCFPSGRQTGKTPVGKRSLRSNKSEQNECDWIHFELQSAFAESLGDLYFSLSSVISCFWPLWATCYLGNTKLQFSVTSYSQRLLRKPLCMTWQNSVKSVHLKIIVHFP